MKKMNGKAARGAFVLPACGDFRVPETAGTRHRDYILHSYEPLCAAPGRLHSVSAYKYLMQAEGWWAAALPLLNALRAGLGPDETVWGAKYGPAGFGSELYFYTHRPNPPGNPKSASRIRKILSPYVEIGGEVPEAAPYFMCSLDLTLDGLKAGVLPEFKLYFGAQNNGDMGYSYLAAKGGLRLENHYSFYRMPDRLGEVRRRVERSARSGRGAGLCKKLLPAYLADCGAACYAVKPQRDALYFSRITTAGLRRFAENYLPGRFARMLAENAGGFSHLLWDVGYDFFSAPRGGVTVDKAGLYGVF